MWVSPVAFSPRAQAVTVYSARGTIESSTGVVKNAGTILGDALLPLIRPEARPLWATSSSQANVAPPSAQIRQPSGSGPFGVSSSPRSPRGTRC